MRIEKETHCRFRFGKFGFRFVRVCVVLDLESLVSNLLGLRGLDLRNLASIC